MKTKIKIEVPADDARLFRMLAKTLCALDGEEGMWDNAENMRNALWEQVTNAEAVICIDMESQI